MLAKLRVKHVTSICLGCTHRSSCSRHILRLLKMISKKLRYNYDFVFFDGQALGHVVCCRLRKCVILKKKERIIDILKFE